MPFGHEIADPDLIRAAREGDRAAVDALVRRHDPWVRQIAYATVGNPAVVDDIAQNVWTSVWQQIETLADADRWRGWLYRLTRNAAIDTGKKISRDRSVGLRLATTVDSVLSAETSDPALKLAEDEQRQQMLQAIQALPDIYREPFVLRHLQDCSYSEIAEAMDMPVATVETRLVRARRLLRESLKGVTRN